MKEGVEPLIGKGKKVMDNSFCASDLYGTRKTGMKGGVSLGLERKRRL
jgi:hypothetical protein